MIDFEINTAEEQHIPFVYKQIPRNLAEQLSEEKPTTQYKIFQRLKTSFDARIDPSHEAKWDTLAVVFLNHLLKSTLTKPLKEVEEQIKLLWPDLRECLGLRPHLLARFATNLAVKLTQGIENGIDFIGDLRKKWLARSKIENSRLMAENVLRFLSSVDSVKFKPDVVEGKSEIAAPAMTVVPGDACIGYLTQDVFFDTAQVPEDQSPDSFIQRMKIVWLLQQLFACDSDIYPFLRGLLPHYAAFRWCLIGWGKWDDRPLLDDLPFDSLIECEDISADDPKGLVERLSKEWRCVWLCFTTLFNALIPRKGTIGALDEHSEIRQSGESAAKVWARQDGRGRPSWFWCPEFLQLGCLILASGLKLETSSKKLRCLCLSVMKETDRLLTTYCENLLADSKCGSLIGNSWICPLAEEAQRISKSAIGRKLIALERLLKKDWNPQPLSLLTLPPRGVKQFSAACIDIRDPEFFAKAKTVVSEHKDEKADERSLKRNYNRQRRGAMKKLRQESEAAAQWEYRDRSILYERQAKEHKRIARTLEQDAVEVAKMKTGLSREMIAKQKSKVLKNPKARTQRS